LNRQLLIIGLLFIALGIYTVGYWWLSVNELIRGVIPIIFILLAGISLTAGYGYLPLGNAYDDKVKLATETHPRLAEFLFKEDWWAIALGLLFVLIGITHVSHGTNFLTLMAVNPGGVKWHVPGELVQHFVENVEAYLFQFVIWASLFSIACRVMGIGFLSFIKSFAFLYLGSLFIFSISGWYSASSFNLEPPLVALLLGLFLANFINLPRWVDPALRVEFYVKTGIVLLGATFPITLVVSAGAVAIGQATFISLLGCLSIYYFSTRLFNLDKRLAAVLSVGGSVCGVSASMAIAAAVGAKKEHIYTSVTLVVVWALIMILFLPFVSKWLALPAGVAGAWIGTSEFADAAGFAAASAYGKMVGNEESAIKAFTLMKVIGRDLWIGIWALVWAFVATTIWTKTNTAEQDHNRAIISNTNRSEIWKRFPKFVLGFFVASIIVTIVSESFNSYQFTELVKPNLIEPINSIRSWVFIFCFFSIGLTTRFRDLKSVNLQTIIPFSMGVIINVIAGFIFSVYIFGEYWAKI